MRFFTKSCISIFLTMSMLLSSSMAAVAETEGETAGTATSAVVEISADIEDKEEMETQILPVASGSQDYMLVMQELRKLVDEYDGKIIYKDFSLPLEKENGVVFSYEIADEESRNYISLQDGTVHITHPAAGMGVKTAVLSVTVQRGNVSIPYEISIKIADEAFVNPFGEESLKKVIALCEQTIGEQKAADNIGTKKAGQLSPDKLEALEIALKEAKACTDVPEMPQHTKALIDAGVAFMGSGVIDNTVLYKSKNPYLDEGDTIVYSVHRAKLERLLWKAKALLLVDEGFYAKSTKEALRAEMKRAELALARDKEGRSMFKLPYVKTRMFVKAPSDYMIQFVIRHKTRIYLYNGFSLGDGFEPVLDWYERDGIMYPAEKDGDIDLELLREHVTKLVDNQRELFTDADTYEEDKRTAKVGAFRKKEYDGVLAAMEEVESEIKGDDVYGLALAAVRFLDAAYDCRMTIALLSDIDVDENGKPRGNLFFTGDEVEDLRKRIKTNDFLKQGYEQIKDGLKGFRADAIEDYWERWKANDQSLWDENPAFVEISQSTGGKFKSGRHVKGTDGKELPANMPSGHSIYYP